VRFHSTKPMKNTYRLNGHWCEIRKTVFGWARTRFPFHSSSAKKLNITDPPIITVTGKGSSMSVIL
jgi:hypothetical protein